MDRAAQSFRLSKPLSDVECLAYVVVLYVLSSHCAHRQASGASYMLMVGVSDWSHFCHSYCGYLVSIPGLQWPVGKLYFLHYIGQLCLVECGVIFLVD